MCVLYCTHWKRDTNGIKRVNLELLFCVLLSQESKDITTMHHVTRRRLIVISLVLPFLLAACQGKKSTSTPPITISWEDLQIERNIPFNTENPALGHLEQRFHLIVPTNHEPLRLALDRLILGDGDATISTRNKLEHYLDKKVEEIRMDEALAEVTPHTQESTHPQPTSCEEIVSTRVAYQDEHVVCIEHDVYYSSSAWAHGMTSACYYNFRLPEATPFTESAIFVEGAEEELRTLLWSKVEQQHAASTDWDADAEAKDLYFSDAIVSNGNFRIAAEGITYCYRQSEAAISALGVVELTLDWKEIAHLLRLNSPVAHLANPQS